MAASSTSYNIKWPAFMQSMLNQFQLALMDVYQTTAIDCLQEMNFYTTFWFSAIGTICVLLLTWVLHQTIPFLFGRLFPEHIKLIRSTVQKITLIFITIMYPAVALKSLSLWNCFAVGDHYYLVTDLSLVCEGPTYRAASYFNVRLCVGSSFFRIAYIFSLIFT